MADPFGKAGVASVGGVRPRLHQLARGGKKVTRLYAEGTPQEQKIATSGRLVLITPTKLEEAGTGSNTGKNAKDRVTANVVVLTGPPIDEVVDARTGEVVTELSGDDVIVPGDANAVIKDMFISSVTLVGQFKEEGTGKLQAGQMFLGYIGRLPARGDNNPAYCLTGYLDEDAEIARKWLATHHNPYADSGDE